MSRFWTNLWPASSPLAVKPRHRLTLVTKSKCAHVFSSPFAPTLPRLSCLTHMVHTYVCQLREVSGVSNHFAARYLSWQRHYQHGNRNSYRR